MNEQRRRTAADASVIKDKQQTGWRKGQHFTRDREIISLASMLSRLLVAIAVPISFSDWSLMSMCHNSMYGPVGKIFSFYDSLVHGWSLHLTEEHLHGSSPSVLTDRRPERQSFRSSKNTLSRHCILGLEFTSFIQNLYWRNICFCYSAFAESGWISLGATNEWSMSPSK